MNDFDNKKNKNKTKNIIFTTLIILFGIVFVCSMYVVISSLVNDAGTASALSKLQELKETETPTERVTPSEGASGETATEDASHFDTSIYDKKISSSKIDIDTVPYLGISLKTFDSLSKINSDTVGWFYMPGPNESPVKGLPIDTPIVQTDNNNFYLEHGFDKQSSSNGWLFMDYRDSDDILENKHTILYAHAKTYSMFGGLKFLNNRSQWRKNGYNHFIMISTPKYDTVWQIFSWYETTAQYNYIRTYFPTGKSFVDFCNEIQSNNWIKGGFETFDFTKDDHILTLSTCKGSNKNTRVAVHAVLVKYVERNVETAE